MKKPQGLMNTALLLEHLAAGLREQMPLAPLVGRLAEAADNPHEKRRLEGLLEQLHRGVPLSEALREWPGLQHATLTDGLQQADALGQLPNMLLMLAQDLRLQEHGRQRARLALLWPTLLMACAAVVSVIISIFVWPQLQDGLELSGADVPALTTVFFSPMPFGESGFTLGFWVAAIVGGLLLWQMLLPSDGLHRVFHRLRLDAGRWALEAQLRLMPLLRGQLPPALVPAYLRYLSASLPIPSIRRRLVRVETRLASGDALGQALGNSGLLPASAVAHLDVAQQTHNLDRVAEQLSLSLQDQWDQANARFERRVTLAIYLMAAFVVFLLLMAVYLPIFKLGQIG